jgi:hypothetical protein
MAARLLAAHSAQLQRAAAAAAELDCLLALAALAAEGGGCGGAGGGYCRPEVTTENVLSIVNGAWRCDNHYPNCRHSGFSADTFNQGLGSLHARQSRAKGAHSQLAFPAVASQHDAAASHHTHTHTHTQSSPL